MRRRVLLALLLLGGYLLLCCRHCWGACRVVLSNWLVKFDEIPWEELAFPTVIKTLKIYLEHGDEKVFNEVLEYKR